MESKKWYLSKTIWGAIVLLVGVIYNAVTGQMISQEEADQAIQLIITVIQGVIDFAGIALVVYGRITAKTAIAK